MLQHSMAGKWPWRNHGSWTGAIPLWVLKTSLQMCIISYARLRREGGGEDISKGAFVFFFFPNHHSTPDAELSGWSTEVHFNLQFNPCMIRVKHTTRKHIDWATFWYIHQNHSMNVCKDVAKKKGRKKVKSDSQAPKTLPACFESVVK